MAEAPVRSDGYGPAEYVGNLADAADAKNPGVVNNTINYFNEIGCRGRVRKAGQGCFSLFLSLLRWRGGIIEAAQAKPTDFK